MNPKFVYFKDLLINMSYVRYVELKVTIVIFHLIEGKEIIFNDFDSTEYNSLCQNLGLI
jgi:hypothetical protein